MQLTQEDLSAQKFVILQRGTDNTEQLHQVLFAAAGKHNSFSMCALGTTPPAKQQPHVNIITWFKT